MIDSRISLLLAIVLAANLTASGIPVGQSQTKQTDQGEPVRLRTELVQVQVVVTDKQGRVIEDLKKDDFERSIQ
jgi:hypothetical protein